MARSADLRTERADAPYAAAGRATACAAAGEGFPETGGRGRQSGRRRGE